MKQLESYRKFLVASVFPVAVVVIDATTAADFASTSGIISFVSALLIAFGVWAVPNRPQA